MKPASRSLPALRGSLGLPGAIVLCAALWTPAAISQQPPPAGGAATAAAATPEAELEQLVARIALYPDDLVALVLPASTNPMQVVQAERFLVKRKSDPKLQVDEKWDDAVKSLLNYPEVITAMSGDLDWTAALGEAVVEDQGKVLEAVQVFRRKAQAAGNLKTDDKQVVVVEKEVVKIVPADPQVVYVPQYNPSSVVVYGSSAWGYYPTPYPSYYYPYAPGAAFATGLIWGAAIGAAWGGNHYSANYGGNANINVNRNTNINTGNINTGNIGSGNRPSQGGGASSSWQPNKQRGQVSSSVGASTRQSRVGDARPSAGTGSSFSGGPSAGTGAVDRSAARGSGPSAGSGAFDGYGSGRQTQMDSSRGAASRQSSTASSRSMGDANRDMGMANRNSGAQSAARAGGGRAGGGGGGGGRGGRR